MIKYKIRNLTVLKIDTFLESLILELEALSNQGFSEELLKKYVSTWHTSPFVFSDINGIILFCNVCFLEQLGYTSEELLGRPITILYQNIDIPVFEERIKRRKPVSYTHLDVYKRQV